MGTGHHLDLCQKGNGNLDQYWAFQVQEDKAYQGGELVQVA
jgi:hypothetical protein